MKISVILKAESSKIRKWQITLTTAKIKLRNSHHQYSACGKIMQLHHHDVIYIPPSKINGKFPADWSFEPQSRVERGNLTQLQRELKFAHDSSERAADFIFEMSPAPGGAFTKCTTWKAYERTNEKIRWWLPALCSCATWCENIKLCP